MGQKRRLRKRPCRICGKWFVPHPRLGERQKTCEATECQQRWHARKRAAWNRKNHSYFKEIYISRQLESSGGSSCPTSSPSRSRRKDLGETGRFRKFHSSEIKERDYKLDITWLKDESLEDANDLPEPQDLAAEAITELEAAIADLDDIVEQLETSVRNGPGKT